MRFSATTRESCQSGAVNPEKETLTYSHEGTHVLDFERFMLNPNTAMDLFQLEYRGYQTSAWSAQALGLPNVSFRGPKSGIVAGLRLIDRCFKTEGSQKWPLIEITRRVDLITPNRTNENRDHEDQGDLDLSSVGSDRFRSGANGTRCGTSVDQQEWRRVPSGDSTGRTDSDRSRQGKE